MIKLKKNNNKTKHNKNTFYVKMITKKKEKINKKCYLKLNVFLISTQLYLQNQFLVNFYNYLNEKSSKLNSLP